MLIKASFFILISIFYFCNAEIKLIQATIRHSDRNPIDGSVAFLFYPKDPYKDRDWYPDGPMELTNVNINLLIRFVILI